MTSDTDGFLIDEPLLVMGHAAMRPGDSGRHFRTIGPEVALGASDAEVMAIRATQSAVPVEFCLVFVEPRLPGWMGMAVMAAFRIIFERTIKIMAGCTSIVGINKDLVIMGGRAMCPVNAGGYPGAAAAEVTL